MAGVHGCEWADGPATGRFDGENDNFGLVSMRDEPWAPLVERMAQVFPAVLEERRAARP
jgi:hypothetical protein